MSDALPTVLRSDALLTCLLVDLRLMIVCVSVCRSWAHCCVHPSPLMSNVLKELVDSCSQTTSLLTKKATQHTIDICMLVIS